MKKLFGEGFWPRNTIMFEEGIAEHSVALLKDTEELTTSERAGGLAGYV
ncbi:hypothetical protein [Haladaptatus sp. DYF46]|nr:hypothetical protein [Haladaptatus sp. DYF46]